jgi:hypothetical protein
MTDKMTPSEILKAMDQADTDFALQKRPFDESEIRKARAAVAELASEVEPIADEQSKDAERWRKLCSLIDVEATVGTFEIEYQIGHVGEYTNVNEPILDGAQLTERVDRAIASAKGDDK